MQLIKASLAAGVRPTTMILGADNRKAWSNLDVIVMQAYQMLEDERCGQCGLPRYLCRNEDPRLQVKIDVEECYTKQEIDKFESERKDKDKSGSAYPQYYSTDGTPLHEFRAIYRAQLAAERADEDD